MTCYLSVADLIRINERMAARWGGVAGVRDMGLVESAVGRPQPGYYMDILEEAGGVL